MHTGLVWKHIIPELVRVETEGGSFQVKAVQARAARRYKKREEAMAVSIKLCQQRCEARGWKFDAGRFNQRLDGIAEVSDEGEIYRSEGLREWLKRSLGDEYGEEEARPPAAAAPAEAGVRTETLQKYFVREGEGKRQRTE